MSAWSRDPRLLLVGVSASATAIALSLTGEVTPVGLAVPAAVAWAVWRPRKEPRGLLFEGIFQLIALGFLGWFAMNLFQGRILGGAAVLTFPVQVHALLQPASLRSLRRLQTIGFFQLVALAASTTAIFFAPLLLLHLALAPAAFTLAGLESAEGSPRRPAALPGGLLRAGFGAAGIVFVLGALIFLALPRYEAGLMSTLRRPGERMSGFSESVTLGDITRIQTSDDIVMRARLRGAAPEDMRWRGIALDRFTGRAWSNTARPRRHEIRGNTHGVGSPTPGARRIVQEIVIEPSPVRALFHLPGATRVTPESFGGVTVDEWDNIQRTDDTRRARYEVVSEPDGAPEELGDDERARFLQLPDLDPRVAEAAAEAVATAGPGASEAARAQAILDWLQRRCSYSLDVDDMGVADPVAWFLFVGRRGHCEYFATTMAVMLRSAGIPSRVVNGFQSGQRSTLFRAWVVRQRDAHSWVEAHVPGRGWMTFDPTPPDGRLLQQAPGALELWRQIEILWDDNVIGFSATAQLGFLTRMGEWWDAARSGLGRSREEIFRVASILAAGAAALAGLVLIRRYRARRASPTRVAFYERAQRLLARRGHRRRPSQTPMELAAQVAATDQELGAAAMEITRMYYDVRYGGARADEDRVRDLLRRLAA